MFLAQAQADHLPQPVHLNVPDLRPDLVGREFKAQGLKQAVGGRHYLRAHEERLRGSGPCALQALPLQALNQAIVSARETTGLIHHSDHGSQYVSVVYNQRLAQHGTTASTGTVGD